MSSRKRREKGWARIAMAVVLGLAIVVAGAAVAFAQGGGGTAKPPVGATSPFVTPTLADPLFSVAPAGIHGFDETGFIQDATVSGDNSACPDVSQANRLGGTVTINNTTIVVPCNMVIQMPANTMTWADMVHGGPSLALKDSPFPSFEVRVVGNIVDGKHIAGLMFASQQAANTGSGAITKIDYDTGDLQVDTGDPANPAIVRDQRSERPLRPCPEPGRALQRRRPEPDDPRRHRLPDVRPAHRPGVGGRPAVPADQPAQARGRRAPLPQLRRRGRHARCRAAAS